MHDGLKIEQRRPISLKYHRIAQHAFAFSHIHQIIPLHRETMLPIAFYVMFLMLITASYVKADDAECNDFCWIAEDCVSNCHKKDVHTTIDSWCDATCKRNQCTVGCREWTVALGSSCYYACNSTEEHTRSQALYCLMGCNSAVSSYMENMKAQVGKIAAPTPIAESITNTSMSLRWNWNSTVLNLNLINKATNISLQMSRYKPDVSNIWEVASDAEWRSKSVFTVANLQPYTSYQFRVVISLACGRQPLISDETATVMTLPHGSPSSAPTNLEAIILDSTQISIAWDPPMFPNGPFISYSLKIRGNSSRSSEGWRQDFLGANRTRSYIFVHLKPNTTYEVSVAAVSPEGEGPTVSRRITTFPTDRVHNSFVPCRLIIVDNKFVYRPSSELVDYDESPIYESKGSNITSLAVHVRQGAYFVADSHGDIYELGLKTRSDNRWTIFENDVVHVQGLSVDWLFDRLYVLIGNADYTKWIISHCKLDGRDLISAITDLDRKPFQMEVDPFNGFLLWAFVDGLYAVDLADLHNGSLSVTAEALNGGKIKCILAHQDVVAFKSDPFNSRVFVMITSETNRTIVAIPYSGAPATIVRHTLSHVDNVSSMTYLNDVFYWINNGHFVFEEMDRSNMTAYANTITPKASSRHTALVLCDVRNQPIPTPLTPVRHLEALFDFNSTQVRWNPPSPVPSRGRGAWQSWSYHIQIRNVNSGALVLESSINDTKFDVNGLHPNTTYAISVQPFATSADLLLTFLPKSSNTGGDSRHTSSSFVGKTLPTGFPNSAVYWATADGRILVSNPIGKEILTYSNVEIFPSKASSESKRPGSRSFDSKNKFLVVNSMAWMLHSIYLVINTGEMYRIDTISRNVTLMKNIEAVSVAVDWYGRKVYWSSAKSQMIGRCSDDGTHMEWLPIIGIANSLAVHSAKGKLCWCTNHAVECSFLNGDELRLYWPSSMESGNQAIGMTIDYDHDHVYWLVRNTNGIADLYKAHIDLPSSAKRVGQAGTAVRGPIQYMPDRLLWLEEISSTVTVSDLNGANTVRLRSPNNQLVTTFFTASSPFAEGLTIRYNVIPVSVDSASIRVSAASAGRLVIVWTSVNNTNYGNVFYDVRVGALENSITLVTADAIYALPISWRISPYTELSVSIRAFTFWGSANVSRASLRSPPSTPEAPLRPRAFVSIVRLNATNDQTDTVTQLRWSAPAKANGELTEYRVLLWRKTTITTDGPLINTSVGGNVTEYTIRGLAPNGTYFFTVQAATKVGLGPQTQAVQFSAALENPVPHLLIVTSKAVWLADTDKHQSLNQSLAVQANFLSPPTAAFAFISYDQQLLWIDSSGDLYLHNLNSGSTEKIYHISGIAESLVIDTISRQAYWSQSEIVGWSIYRLDLNQEVDEATPQIVLQNKRMLRLVEIDPLSSRLIYTEANVNGSITLMNLNISSGEHTQFFQHARRCGRNASSRIPPLAPGTVTAVDWSDSRLPRLFWLLESGEIWSADWKGTCFPTVEMAANELKRTGGLPASSLAVDRSHLYWADRKEGKVYRMRRPSASRASMMTPSNQIKNDTSAHVGRTDVSVELANISKILARPATLQPLPSVKCLAPSASDYRVQLHNVTSNTMTLSMPVPLRPKECQGISMARPYYHIYYGPVTNKDIAGCLVNLRLCQIKKTYSTTAYLDNLSAYTNYTIRLRMTNHYSPDELSFPIGGAVFVFTPVGAPSKPREVTAVPLSPHSVRVQWMQPAILNGAHISYWVYSQLDSKFSSFMERPPKVLENVDPDQQDFSVVMEELMADMNYSFKVRAYSTNGQWSQSDFVASKTYAYPESLMVDRVSSNSVTLKWNSPNETTILRHVLEMKVTEFADWRPLDNQTQTMPNHNYEFVAQNLAPLVSYSFRLQLEYFPLSTPFTWPVNREGIALRTQGNAPGRPHSPRVKKSFDNFIELWWAPSTNTYSLHNYLLEMRVVESASPSNSSHETTADSIAHKHSAGLTSWIAIYNGSDNFFVAHNLSSGRKYQFRVQALNEVGASEFSEPSPTFKLQDVVWEGTPTNINMILTVSLSALVAFCSVMAILIFYVCRRSSVLGKEKQANASIHSVPVSEMSDLATLRELPHRESFVQQNNAIYGVGDGDLEQELALLPHIRFEDLLITKFLGRGAFGEVFEGTTSNLPGSNQCHARVAVKTLRKGATVQEKSEFLKEAILMSHFKHKHILRLLGVCLDADPNFILLELMEGGDLLSFLRNNRPGLHNVPINSTGVCHLGLLDLVSMCVDVAKGCCYLEELHFVHRDLAARNCLVSSLDPQLRVVKIGDFGLARDIYRNDYYRKEGEGLLPVRWMAPESLVDGVFTSQTDVWSFGVLLWEILTLGQQPYPARTNLQVLHFVRTGGRLDRPPECPDSLFQLMMRCWSYSPSARPTFTQCLEELLSLQEVLQHSPFTAVHNGHYCGGALYGRWETHCDSSSSSGSCAYLEQNSLEQAGTTLYSNAIIAALHGVSRTMDSSSTGKNGKTRRPKRCASARVYRNQKGEHVSVAVARSNSSIEQSDPTGVNAHERYLELLSDTFISEEESSNRHGFSQNARYESLPPSKRRSGKLTDIHSINSGAVLLDDFTNSDTGRTGGVTDRLTNDAPIPAGGFLFTHPLEPSDGHSHSSVCY